MPRIIRRAPQASSERDASAQEAATHAPTPPAYVPAPPVFPPTQVEDDPLRDSLQRARRVAPDLASATNAVNSALERVEEALTSLNLGVSASVDLYPAFTWDPGDWRQKLRFGKDGSVWRLLLEGHTVGDYGDEEDDPTQSPLLSASKEIRLRAIERLPALINALVAVAEAQIGEFRTAAEKAEAIVTAIAELK
jgi:hypothetical protein